MRRGKRKKRREEGKNQIEIHQLLLSIKFTDVNQGMHTLRWATKAFLSSVVANLKEFWHNGHTLDSPLLRLLVPRLPSVLSFFLWLLDSFCVTGDEIGTGGIDGC